ncbi:30S ribosomal protein S20 [Buchnera aphidicola]|uniref:30S ribosomal protein S20 n=1 Tax=Buchnera aphidicola TaxID=9 RepID=UPI00094DA638|nr:30S ribosomal protein S20 [Buchnera aphidicola]
MANIKSSKKHALLSEKRRKLNASKRSKVKTFIKKVYSFIQKKDKAKANQAFSLLQSIIDRYSVKGILHFNKAARHKSRLIKSIQRM